MLRMSYSTVCLLLWFALPGEPWGTSGKADSQRSPSSALWTLDSLCLETSTAWEIENNSRTSVEIMHIYCRYCKSSGHNYMFISHFKTVGNFSTSGSQLRWTQTATWSYRERERLKLTCTSFCSAVYGCCVKENIYVAQQPTLSCALGMVCTGIGRHSNWGMMGAGRLVGGNIPARQAWALMRVRS